VPIERTIDEKFGQPVIQWQLSSTTVGSWTWLLAAIVEEVLNVAKNVPVREAEQGNEGGTQ